MIIIRNAEQDAPQNGIFELIRNTELSARQRLEEIGKYFGCAIQKLSLDLNTRVIINAFNSLNDDEFVLLINQFSNECNIVFEPTRFFDISKEAWIDKTLLSLANTLELDMSSRVAFFDKVRKYSVTKYQDLVNPNLEKGKGIKDIDTLPLPITAYYILHTDRIFENEKILRSLKTECKILQRIVKEMYNLNGDEEAEETISPLSINHKDLWQLHSISLNNATSFADEGIGMLQYLRIIRECVNEHLASNAIDLAIANEQISPNPFIQPFRVGREYTALHERFYRCYSFFLSQHAGKIAANTFGVESRFGNINNINIPVGPDLLTFVVDMSGSNQNANIEPIINAIRTERPDLVEKFANHSQTKISIQVALEFLTKFLERIGLLSTPELAATQIAARNSRTNMTEPPKTLTILVEENRKLAAMNSSFGLVLLPGNAEYTWNRIIASFALHEVTHFIQQIAFNSSLFPGSQYFSSLGRSAFLAEAGAINNQKIINILGKSSESGDSDEESSPENRYHWIAVLTHLLGGNYLKVANDVRIAKVTKGKTISGVATSITRMYSNFGATADSCGNHFQYPSSFALLRYIYQKMPAYNNQPYYVSKIPSHRLDELSWIFQNEFLDPKALAIIALEIFDEMQK